MADKEKEIVSKELKEERKILTNPLLNALSENDKKNLFKTNVTTAFIKTGFPLFDYYFGAVMNVHDENGNIIRQDPRIGQAAGTFNLILGNSGTGKSTLSSQIAANIIRQFPFANVIHFDCENRFDLSRAETITKLPSYYFDNTNGPERYMIKGGAIGLDAIQEMIVKLYSNKLKLKDEMLIDSGFKDEFNKPVLIYQPTVIIIDSMPSVISETFSAESSKDMKDMESMRSNTDGARDAKTIKGFFKDVLPMCKESNIIIYAINHINTNMSMNAFLPVAKQQNFMKQDERIPGGSSMIYYPYNIVKLVAKTGSADEFKEDIDGFDGHIVQVEPVKSSSNQSGNNSKGVSFNLVFSYKTGFDSLRSLILYGRDHGIIEGNRNRLKFKDNPNYTFSFKNIYQDKKTNPIWEDIKKYIIPNLDTHLSYTNPNERSFDNNDLDY